MSDTTLSVRPTAVASNEMKQQQQAARDLSFAALCRLLEAVERTPANDAKLKLVFSDALREQLAGGDLYPLMRLLLPQLDRERTYNLKEKKIAKMYIDVLGMAPQSRDAHKLEHFNDPTVVRSASVGDFGAVLGEVLQYRSLLSTAAQATLHTVGTVNDLLDQLVRNEGANTNTITNTNTNTNANTNARRQLFLRLATEFPAQQQKWIIRMMLKDLKIGLRHERVLSYMHPDAMEMYNHTNDLHRVCTDLRNSEVRYVPQITPFQVFSPMLAKRVDFGECTRAINADAFVMEPKLDGERITCHVQDGVVQFISRNGVNYTELYGFTMGPIMTQQLVAGVDLILDGEMMVWDNLEYRLREFGLLKNVANALRAAGTGGDNGNAAMASTSTHRWLCYVVWDIVYLGGSQAETLIREVYQGPGELHAVMGLPLHVRRRLLLKVVHPLENRLVIIEQTLVDSPSPKDRHERVMAEVDRQVANGGEGVILKDIHSHYMCGETSRKAKKWIKLKPDYAGMTTDLDCVILGGYYGTGRRRSGAVSVFLLGVLARATDDNAAQQAMAAMGEPAPTFYTFAKVGTGYNHEELAELRRELAPYWQPWDSEKVPPHLNGWRPSKSDLRPDVWIDPRHSKILEVYGFELTFTTLYQAGLTIRFPRCKAIRHDKPWHQCMSLQDLHTIRGSAVNGGIGNKRAADVSLGQKRAAKRGARGTRSTTTGTSSSGASIHRDVAGSGGVVAAFSRAKLENVDVQKELFVGHEFCVLPGKYESAHTVAALYAVQIPESIVPTPSRALALTKQAIEKVLHSYGASLVQNPMVHSTQYVLAASATGMKVANLRQQGTFNVVHQHWVWHCIAAQRVLPLKARDFVSTTEATRALLAREYDRYGDHYTEPVTPEELKLVFGEVQRVDGNDSGNGSGGGGGDEGVRIEDKRELGHVWQQRLAQCLPAAEDRDAMLTEWTCLAHCVVYVDRFHSFHTSATDLHGVTDRVDPTGGSLLTLEQELRLYGARIAPTVEDDAVTHIVLQTGTDRDRIACLRPVMQAIRRQRGTQPAAVTSDWARQCVAQHTQLPIDAFLIPV